MTSITLASCLQRAVCWTKTEQAEFPYITEVDGQSWRIRINDFPEQPLYTLFVQNQQIGSFDEWSPQWQR